MAQKPNFDQYDEAFEKEKEFWKNANETLDDDEYIQLAFEKGMRKKSQNDSSIILDDDELKHFVDEYNHKQSANVTKKENDLDKFNEFFRQQSEFWSNAKESLDEDGFEKFVEKECSLKPFSSNIQKDDPLKPRNKLFQKQVKFWGKATNNLDEHNYKVFVRDFIKSDKTVRLQDYVDKKPLQPEARVRLQDYVEKKPLQPEAREAAGVGKRTQQEDEDVKPFPCTICGKRFRHPKLLSSHTAFSHGREEPTSAATSAPGSSRSWRPCRATD